MSDYPKFAAIQLLLLFGSFILLGCQDNDDGINGVGRANNPPVIRSITASPDTLEIYNYGTIEVACLATDSEGDSLSYLWYVPRGHPYSDYDAMDNPVCWYFSTSDLGDWWCRITVSDGSDVDVDSIRVTIRQRG